ncbi:MAG: hypothetical protein KBD60_12120 [Sterolibacterium sp.]|jgi:type II secretory pathway component PulC|nr:hypothetical protein [Sterolibacterium sp.]
MRVRLGLASLNAAFLNSWLGALASLIMLALIAWLCASIYWTITVPATPVATRPIDTDPQHTAQSLASRHLFGIATTPAPSAAAAPTDLRLNGVIAAQAEGQPAYAFIIIEGKPAQVVREGTEFAPGITLKRVLPREVELLRHGQPQTLSLPQPATPAPIRAERGAAF